MTDHFFLEIFSPVSFQDITFSSDFSICLSRPSVSLLIVSLFFNLNAVMPNVSSLVLLHYQTKLTPLVKHYVHKEQQQQNIFIHRLQNLYL